MEQSSSYDEKTVRHQFDRKCKLALKGEVVDYERHLAYLRKHEVLFSELSEREIENFSIINEYALEKSYFRAGGYDVVVKDALLAEALKALTERKRDVILLSYFMEMNDADIARKLNLVRACQDEDGIVVQSIKKLFGSVSNLRNMENGFARIVKEFQNRLLRMLLLNPIECYVQIIRMY